MNKILVKILPFAALALTALPQQALAFSAGMHIPEKYSQVQAGERLYFDVDIKYPENASRKDLQLVYQVIHDGEVIAESRTLKAVETQISFLDYIVVPDSVHGGTYAIQVKMTDGEKLNKTLSGSFEVAAGTDIVTIYFFVMLAAVLVVGVAVSWQISLLKKQLP